MKALTLFLLSGFALSFPAKAAMETQSDAQQLGLIAGAAQACKAYKDVFIYEEIASRLISVSAGSENAEQLMLQEYAQAKGKSFKAQRLQNRVPCSELLTTFSKMPIFKFELYSDGTLKSPQGKYLYPRGQKTMKSGSFRVYPPLPRPQQPPMPQGAPFYPQAPYPPQGYAQPYPQQPYPAQPYPQQPFYPPEAYAQGAYPPQQPSYAPQPYPQQPYAPQPYAQQPPQEYYPPQPAVQKAAAPVPATAKKKPEAKKQSGASPVQAYYRKNAAKNTK